jgi:hypothetical protein
MNFVVIFLVFQFYRRVFKLDLTAKTFEFLRDSKYCVEGLMTLNLGACRPVISDCTSFTRELIWALTASDSSPPFRKKLMPKIPIRGELKNELLRNYLEFDQKTQAAEDCFIGVGYNACTDINFRASELIALIEPLILKMEEEEGEPVEAKVHTQITNLREFIETFAYQFMHGANAERVSNSRDLFYLLYDTLKQSNLQQRDELGGHSPVWALRAQREKCKVFISAQSTPTTEAQMNYKSIESDKPLNDYLVWP